MVYSVVVQSGLLPGGGGRHGRRPLPRGAYEFLREGWYWVIKSLVFVVVRCARNTVGEIIHVKSCTITHYLHHFHM